MKKEELKSFLKDRRIRGYSSKKKDVLEKKVSEIKEKEASEEYERKFRDEAVFQPVRSSKGFNVKSMRESTISDCSRIP